ncbi:ABC transporter permease [Pendulispora albinea]|uniref:FtsX-like permease family protein n=1 Tax=Pendulispora albinea TaxID=2741071 RepID=A0ABZ2LPA8_9BACT
MEELGPIFRAMLRNKVKFGLIVVEIALTLAVVANCAAMILKARREISQPSGFDDENLLIVTARPLDSAMRKDESLADMLRRDREAVRATPGVHAMLETFFTPWGPNLTTTGVRPAESTMEQLTVQSYPTGEGLTETLGINLVEGREFSREDVDRDTQRAKVFNATQHEHDARGKPLTSFEQDVVISQAFAKHAFGDGPYVGRWLDDEAGTLFHVVGVVDRFYKPGLASDARSNEHVMFYADRDESYGRGFRALVRTEPGQAVLVARDLEERLARPGEPRQIKVERIPEVRTTHFGPQRLVTTLMGVVIALLVLVTALGIAGLTTFSVTERTRQIGTRRALGATTGDILRYFLAENWLLTTLGLVLGFGLAMGLNVIVVSVFAGAKLNVPLLVLSMILLWSVGLGSAIAPALRGARISPAVATRNI